MPNDETLAAHLAHARAQRNKDRLREHAREMSRKQYPELLSCTCGAGEGEKHKSTCCVYRREQARNRRRKDEGQ